MKTSGGTVLVLPFHALCHHSATAMEGGGHDVSRSKKEK